jgi:hypothetical protein
MGCSGQAEGLVGQVMGERHNNTVPAKRGSYVMSRTGIVYYFPIEDAGWLKPFQALMLYQRPDGHIVCGIDQRWDRLEGYDDG